LYVISENEWNEVSLVKVDGNEVEPIEDEKEYNEVFKELVNRNKEEISKYLEGIDEN
jgi:hypothetical protein